MKILVITNVFTPSMIADMQESGRAISISSTAPKTLIEDLNLGENAIIYCTPNAVLPTAFQKHAAEKNWELKSIPENFTTNVSFLWHNIINDVISEKQRITDTKYLILEKHEWWIL